MYPLNPFINAERDDESPQDGQGIVKVEEREVVQRNPSVDANPLVEIAAQECFWDKSHALKFKTALRLEVLCLFSVIIFSYFFKITEAWKMLHILDDVLHGQGSGFDVPPLSAMLLHELPRTVGSLLFTLLFLSCGYQGLTKRSTCRMRCWNCCTFLGACNAFMGVIFCVMVLFILPGWTEYAVKCDARPICMPDGKVTNGTLGCLDGSEPNEAGMTMPKQCHGLESVFIKCPESHPRAYHHEHGMPLEPEFGHHPPMHMFITRFFVHGNHPPMLGHDFVPAHGHFRFIHMTMDPYSMHHRDSGVLHMGWKNITQRTKEMEDTRAFDFCTSSELTGMFRKNMFCCRRFRLRCDLVEKLISKKKDTMRKAGRMQHASTPKFVRGMVWCASTKNMDVAKKNYWCCKMFEIRCPEDVPAIMPGKAVEDPVVHPDEMPVSIALAEAVPKRKLHPLEPVRADCKVNVDGVNYFHTYVLAQPRLEVEVYLQLFVFLMIYLIMATVHTFACYTGVKLRQEIQEARDLTHATDAQYPMYPLIQSREVPLLNQQQYQV